MNFVITIKQRWDRIRTSSLARHVRLVTMLKFSRQMITFLELLTADLIRTVSLGIGGTWTHGSGGGSHNF